MGVVAERGGARFYGAGLSHKESTHHQYECIPTGMAAFSAAKLSSDNQYEDGMLAGGCSSCDTKSRCQPGYMRTRSQSVLDAPASAYAALPIRWDRNASDFIEHSEKHGEKYLRYSRVQKCRT
jgi:hypothetical protein